MRGGPGIEGVIIGEEDVEAFRQCAESIVFEMRDAAYADAGDLDEGRSDGSIVTEYRRWRSISDLPDVVVTALLRHGVYDRGMDAREILALVEALSKSERDPKKVRGPGAKTLALREHIADVVGSFEGSMSGRQVFYQLVSRGAVQNTALAYEGVLRLLVNMRRDGSIPYGRIVDRTRRVHKLPGWAGVREAMQALASQYRRDPWDDQPVHVHVGCEKQALEGVFSDVVDNPYGAPLYVLRGFASEAFVYEWATEIERVIADGHRVVVAYFGDHDPSGLMIERDCRSRLASHLSATSRNAFDWQRFGLLHEDLERFDLVNVPVKSTDSRARAYLAEYGDRAAELDALPPAVLRERILEAIVSHVDSAAWERVRTIEQAETESLDLVAGSFERAVAAARSAA